MAWESYEKTEQIVMNYKAREPFAAEELLNAFESFINKYYEVIAEGKLDLSNQSIRKFISLFIRENDYKKNIHKYAKSPTVITKASSSVNYLRSIFSVYEKDEIRSMLSIALLELADKYKPIDDNPRFHAYLLKSYHYRVFHMLISITKDPLYECMKENGYFKENDTEVATYDVYNFNKLDKNQKRLFTEPDITVDDNWVAGFTSDIFSNCSPVDRKILKLKYVDGLTDTEIGEELSVCRATVNRRRIKVESELKERLTKLNILKE